MPSNSQANLAGFFGGLASGISQGIQQKKQREFEEKMAVLKMKMDIYNSAISNPNYNGDPQALFDQMFKDAGLKDKDTQRIQNVIRSAPSAVEAAAGQAMGQYTDAYKSATGSAPNLFATPAPPPSTTLTLPAGPKPALSFTTAADREKALLDEYQKKKDIDVGGTIKEDEARAKFAAGKPGPQMTGADINEILGTSLPTTKLYATKIDASGNLTSYLPVAPKPGQSPLERETAVQQQLHPEWTPDEAKTAAATKMADAEDQAAKDKAALTKMRLQMDALSLSRGHFELSTAEEEAPLRTELLNARLSKNPPPGLQGNLQKIASGNPKQILEAVNSIATERVTNPSSRWYQHSLDDVRAEVTRDFGVDDYKTLKEQAKVVPPPETVPSAQGGAASTSTPAPAPTGRPAPAPTPTGGATTTGGQRPQVVPKTLKAAAGQTIPQGVLAALAGKPAGGPWQLTAPDGKTKVYYNIDPDGTVRVVPPPPPGG